MASSLIIEVCKVENVEHHPNADKLDLVRFKGWQCVMAKNVISVGDSIVYFPPDTCLPEYVARQLGIFDYLKGGKDNKRIGQIRLRGEPSFGVALPCKDTEWEVGQDVSGYYGATKWEPPMLGMQGDIAGKPHPLFVRYTDIENIRNFPKMFEEGEEVVVTEKIHGTNVRIGCIEDEWMAGSHRLPRKRPDTEKQMAANWYWMPYTIPAVQDLINSLSVAHKQVILFGETYGKVQNLDYGLGNKIAFRAFDLFVDGKYLNYGEFARCCEANGVPIVPMLDLVTFSMDKMEQKSKSISAVPGATHIMEGIVVKPTVERHSELLGGRLVGKYVATDYLLSKHHEKDTTDN